MCRITIIQRTQLIHFKLLIAYELIYALAIGFIKLSVLFFYLRVFVSTGFRLATKLSIAFVMLWSIGNILQVFLICYPFEATYNPAISGTCGDQIGSFVALGVSNVVTDALILALPIRTVWMLQASVGTRVGLSAVFLIGLLSVLSEPKIMSLC